MEGDKGIFQCKGKGCTSDVEFEEPKDTKCPKCGRRYGFVNGKYKHFGRFMELVYGL